MKAIRIFSTCLLLLPFVSCTQVANKGSDAATEKKSRVSFIQNDP